MNSSKLSYQAILNISNNLSRNSDSMQSLLNEIRSLFDKIGDEGVWSGTAANKAHDKFKELYDKFPNFYEAVKDTSKYLNEVVANYQAVDDALLR